MTTKLWSILMILALGVPLAASQTPAVATSKVKIQKITIQGNHVFTAAKIKDIRVTGNKQFTIDEIRRAVGMTPGQVYNEAKLRKGLDKLKQMYDSRGFHKFALDPSFMFDETKKVVSLTIDIREV